MDEHLLADPAPQPNVIGASSYTYTRLDGMYITPLTSTPTQCHQNPLSLTNIWYACSSPHASRTKTSHVHCTQGSVVSAIGHGIVAVISAIADVVITIVEVIVSASPPVFISACPSFLIPKFLPFQVIVSIFDFLAYILCCGCCSSRRSFGSSRSFRSRPMFGRRRGLGTTF